MESLIDSLRKDLDIARAKASRYREVANAARRTYAEAQRKVKVLEEALNAAEQIDV